MHVQRERAVGVDVQPLQWRQGLQVWFGQTALPLRLREFLGGIKFRGAIGNTCRETSLAEPLAARLISPPYRTETVLPPNFGAPLLDRLPEAHMVPPEQLCQHW